MRIDPNKVPHLITKDGTASKPLGQLRGGVPKQTNFSVQDVRDYSTPQGAAMANEEMRRLRLVIDKVKATVEQPVTSDTPITTTVTKPSLVSGEEIESPEQGGYTVSHNNIIIGELNKNTHSNYIDGVEIEGSRYNIQFELYPTGANGEKANIKAYVTIPDTDDLWYIEEFYVDNYFSNSTYALLSDMVDSNHRFGTKTYKDIRHNFNLENIYDYVYSITYTGDYTKTAVAIVRPIDKNTVRVYSDVKYGIDNLSVWEVGNTRLHPNASYIDNTSKEGIPKFVIVMHTNRSLLDFVTVPIISGMSPDFIHTIVISGMLPDTIHNVILTGGTF